MSKLKRILLVGSVPLADAEAVFRMLSSRLGTLAKRYPDVWEGARGGQEHGQDHGSTFPSDEPVARIDYLFADPTVRPLRAWTAGGTDSDHLMVIADLQVGG